MFTNFGALRRAETPGLQSPQREIRKKKDRFCRHDDIKVLHCLHYSLSLPLTSADDWNIEILKKNVIKNYVCNTRRRYTYKSC